ncbi:MAG: hypothetical protein ACYDHH_24365 [Solirubrobacteraceae bacterium]
MQGNGIFISSCSRRELARRRPTRKSSRPLRSGYSDVGSGRSNRTGFGAGASRGRWHGLVAGVTMPATVLGLPLLVLAVALVAALAIAGRF